MVGGQRDEVVEHPRHLTRLPLEALDLVVGELGQWRVVVVGRHELVTNVSTSCPPTVMLLYACCRKFSLEEDDILVHLLVHPSLL